jgi:hypothetical protein
VKRDKGALRLVFDRRLMLQFLGSAITSDTGLLPYRELDDALGLTNTGADTLADARTGKNGRHRLAGLLIEDQDLTPYLRLRRPCDPDYCNFCNYWAWVAVPLALVG